MNSANNGMNLTAATLRFAAAGYAGRSASVVHHMLKDR
jgi:hypothetical protein